MATGCERVSASDHSHSPVPVSTLLHLYCKTPLPESTAPIATEESINAVCLKQITDIGDRHPSSINHSPLERQISEYNNKTREEELITLLLKHEVGQRNNSREKKKSAGTHTQSSGTTDEKGLGPHSIHKLQNPGPILHPKRSCKIRLRK